MWALVPLWLPVTTLTAALTAVAAIVIGSRSESTGSDTALYLSVYSQMLRGEEPSFRFEFLYELLAGSFAALGLPAAFFFTFLSLICFVVIGVSAYQAARYFGGGFSGARYLLVLLISLAASPIFLSAQINVVRQGLAAVLLILFGILLLRRANGLSLMIVAGLAIGFHYTSAVYLAAILLVRMRQGAIYGIVACCSVLYLTGLSEQLVKLASSVSPVDVYGAITAYGTGYEYRRGVRFDFALFTIGAGALVSVVGLTMLSGAFRGRYLAFTNIYWTSSLPFMLFGFGAFSDRFLFVGWLFLSWLVAVAAYALVAIWKMPGAVLVVLASLAVFGLCLSVSSMGPAGALAGS